MPAALLGAQSCGRCGHGQPAAAQCARCGTTWTPAAGVDLTRTDTGVLAGVVRASLHRRQLAYALDSVVVLVPVGVAVLGPGGLLDGRRGTGSGLWAGGWVAVALVVGVTQLVVALGRGRSLGRWLLRLRTVDDLTGTPIGFRRRLGALRRGRRRLVTADLGRGHDPLEMRTAAVPLGSAAGSSLGLAPDAGDGASRRSRQSVWIVLDDGARHEIHQSLLVGRNPVDADGAGRALLAWPDLSRSLGRTHTLLEWSGTVLWVTDLGSATGTTVLVPGSPRLPLAPRVPTAVAVGSRIELGSRSLTVAGGWW